MEPIFVLQAVNTLLLAPIYFMLWHLLNQVGELNQAMTDHAHAIGVLEGQADG